MKNTQFIPSRNYFVRYRILLIMFVFTLSGSLSATDVHAQGGDLVWTGAMGGELTDMAHRVAVDASGNVYTTGCFQGTADFDPGDTTFNLTGAAVTEYDPYICDVFVSKLDSDGNFLWAKAVRGTNDKKAWGIAIDTSSNIYISGSFKDTVDFDPGPAIFNLTSKGENDIFAMKLDSNGNFIWAKTIGMAGDDRGIFIAVDASANVYFSGCFENTVDFNPGAGEFNLTSTGGNDIFICKLDSNGNFIWARAMEGLGNGNAVVALDASGNVYLAGVFEGITDFDPGPETLYLTSNGSWDIFICKLDNNGNFIWAKAIGGYQFDVANDIVLDPSGNIYLTGSFEGAADFDPGTEIYTLTSTSSVGEDIFVLKLDNSGNLVWAKAMGGDGRIDAGFGIAVDVSANVYTTGYFTGTADFDPGPKNVNLTSVGDYDLFISKLDKNGNYSWAKAMGGVGLDIGTGIAVNNAADIYITGAFEGTVDFDSGNATDNLTSAGQSDVFVSKLVWEDAFPWPLFLPGLTIKTIKR